MLHEIHYQIQPSSCMAVATFLRSQLYWRLAFKGARHHSHGLPSASVTTSIVVDRLPWVYYSLSLKLYSRSFDLNNERYYRFGCFGIWRRQQDCRSLSAASACHCQGPTTSGVGEHGYKGPFDGLKRTAQTEGIAGLYRGFGAVILWVTRVWHHHFVSLLIWR
jgi:hypothetical protein